MTPEDVRTVQAQRFAYLQWLYLHWQGMAAGRGQMVKAETVREALGLSPNEGDRIEEYLKERQLIEYVTFGPTLAITVSGIDHVEEALAAPDQKTEYFPPINILNIENVIRSQIQQGTTHGTQDGAWQEGVGADELAAVIKATASLLELQLSASQRQDVEAAVKTLEAQATSSKPNRTIVREVLASVRVIAEGAGGNLAAAEILKYLVLFGSALN